MVFFSKKQKKATAARKAKAKAAMPTIPALPLPPAPEITLTMPSASKSQLPDTLKIVNPKDVKSPQVLTSNYTKILPKTVTIKVPSNLTGADLRDFRKKKRREVRALNKDNIVVFEEKGKANNEQEEDATTQGKTAPKAFPRLNDLVQKEADLKKQTSLDSKNAVKQQRIDDKETAKFMLSQPSAEEQGNYVALDCEMVGVGAGGKASALARVSIVDFHGNTVMDKHVEVKERVTDFRTHVSGVRASDLKGKGDVEMVSLKDAQNEVFLHLKGKILVGHALHNDFKALMMDHPKHMVRDTAKYPPFMRKGGRGGGKLKPRKLRDLVTEILKVEGFQKSIHDSTKDAGMTMELYKVVRGDWEEEMKKKERKAAKAKAQRGGAAGEKCWKGMGIDGFVWGGSDDEDGEVGEGGEEDDVFDYDAE